MSRASRALALSCVCAYGRVGDGTFETSSGGPLVVASALLVRGTDGYIGIMAMRYIAVTYKEDKEAVAITFERRDRYDDQLLRRDRQHGAGGDRRDR